MLVIAGTGGLGKGIISALIPRGASIILTSTRQEKLDSTIGECLSLYPEFPKPSVRGYTLDLGSSKVEENVKALVTNLKKDGIDKIHHLVYVAGNPLPNLDIQDITLESWSDLSQVRTISCILCIKHLVPLIQAAGPASADFSASITITSGSVSDKPIPGGWMLSAMIAAAVDGAARQLALDLKPIRVNSVSPGVVDTELWDKMDAETRANFMKERAGVNPTGRVGTASDVAEAYLWVMCDGNTTGEVVRTNSGVLLI